MTRLSRLLLLAYLVLLAVAVLTPTPSPNPPDPLAPAAPMDGLVADLVRNLLLMLPLGWLLAAAGASLARTLALGLTLSLLIELAQLGIPGRHGTASDVIANSLSAAAGAGLYATRLVWHAPVGPAARWLAGGAFAAACAVLVLGVQALRPSLRGPEYFAGLRPDLGHYERYAGRVAAVRLGALALSSGPIGDDAAVAAALSGFQPLVVEAELRPSSGDPAAIFTIHDAEQHEIFALVAERRDLFVYERMHAADLGLDQPVHRWSDALAEAPEAPSATALSEIRLERHAGSVELWIGGRSLGTRSWRPGSVGGLLLTGRVVPARAIGAFEALTIALLALPCAYYARSAWPVALGLAFILLVLPRLGPVGPPAVSDWIGLAFGIGLARVARTVVGRRLRMSSDADSPRLSATGLWC